MEANVSWLRRFTNAVGLVILVSVFVKQEELMHIHQLRETPAGLQIQTDFIYV